MNRISDTALALLRSGKRQGVDILFEPVTVASGQPTQITITEKDIVKNSFSIDRYSITGDKIEFGCCSAAELNFTLDNTNGKWNGYVFGGGKLTVKSRIEVNGTNQYVKLGVFYIDNMPRRLQQIEITALDRMVSLQNPVSSATKAWLQGEHTLADVFEKIVSDNSLSWSSEKTAYFALNNNEFANFVGDSNLKFSLKEGEDITYHELLMRCCELSGSCAYFDGDGYLSVAWYNDLMKNGSPETVLKLSASDRFSSDIYESANALSGIQYEKQDETTVYVGTDSNPYIIEEQIFNPISTSINLFIQKLWTIRQGFSYTPFSATVKSFPNVFPLDKIKFVRNDGTEFETIVTHTVYKLNSNMDIEAVGETEEQAGYAKLAQMTAYEKAMIEKIAAQSAGKSAYEIAVEEGFVGTEEEWLESLNGESIAIKNLYKRFSIAQIILQPPQPPDSSTISSWSETPLSATDTYKYVYVTQGTYIDGVAQYDFSTPILFSEYTKRVSSVVEEFIKTNSPSTAPSQSDSNWSTTVPDWEEGKYIWTRIKTTYTDSSIERTTPTLATSINNAGRTAAASLDFNKVISSGMGLLEYTDPTTHSKYYYCGTPCVTGYNNAVASGYQGTAEQWVDWLKSSNSDSDYADAVSNGFEGTKADWVNSLIYHIADATYIVKFDSGGFAYSYNWNSGNPTWTYGIDRNGNAILNILTARKIQADQIETGAITAEKIQAHALTSDQIATDTLRIGVGQLKGVAGSIRPTIKFSQDATLEYYNSSENKDTISFSASIQSVEKDVDNYWVATVVITADKVVPSYYTPAIGVTAYVDYKNNGAQTAGRTVYFSNYDGRTEETVQIQLFEDLIGDNAPFIIGCYTTPNQVEVAANYDIDGLQINRDFLPAPNGRYNLGTMKQRTGGGWVTRRWDHIYLFNSPDVVSDRKLKSEIEPLDQRYSDMFYKLNPVSYKLNFDSSRRRHVGLVAQDVESAMMDSGISIYEFAGISISGDERSLRYEEFIPMCINEIQRLQARVEELEKIKRIES